MMPQAALDSERLRMTLGAALYYATYGDVRSKTCSDSRTAIDNAIEDVVTREFRYTVAIVTDNPASDGTRLATSDATFTAIDGVLQYRRGL